MQLIINAAAAELSSRGVQRYLTAVSRHLSWPEPVEILAASHSRALERARELLRRGRGNAVFWTPCQRGPIWARQHVITVHDCISVEYTYAKDWRLGAYLRLYNAVLGNAAAIVAISTATKHAILRNYQVDEARIEVVRSGDDAFPALARNEAAVDTHSQPFILMVINSLPHKNATLACAALASSRAAARRMQLRVVGSLPQSAVDACRGSGLELQIHRAVDDDTLREWYRSCTFLLSPSLDEGHNLPIAEALSCGGRVLCSDIPVHHEYYEGRVVFFEPRRQDAIVHAIDAALDGQFELSSARPVVQGRSFADVARDYEAIFTAVGRRTGRA